jgi:hypothetical protein
MLSLFCVVVCVVAHATKNAAHRAEILQRKTGRITFIDFDLVVITGSEHTLKK